jgi:hypothetical protein
MSSPDAKTMLRDVRFGNMDFRFCASFSISQLQRENIGNAVKVIALTICGILPVFPQLRRPGAAFARQPACAKPAHPRK